MESGREISKQVGCDAKLVRPAFHVFVSGNESAYLSVRPRLEFQDEVLDMHCQVSNMLSFRNACFYRLKTLDMDNNIEEKELTYLEQFRKIRVIKGAHISWNVSPQPGPPKTVDRPWFCSTETRLLASKYPRRSAWARTSSVTTGETSFEISCFSNIIPTGRQSLCNT